MYGACVCVCVCVCVYVWMCVCVCAFYSVVSILREGILVFFFHLSIMVAVWQVWSVTYLLWLNELVMVSGLVPRYLSETRKIVKAVGLESLIKCVGSLVGFYSRVVWTLLNPFVGWLCGALDGTIRWSTYRRSLVLQPCPSDIFLEWNLVDDQRARVLMWVANNEVGWAPMQGAISKD